MQPTFYATSQQIIVCPSDPICSEKQEVVVFEFPENITQLGPGFYHQDH